MGDPVFRLQIQNISSQSNLFDDVTRKIGALDFTIRAEFDTSLEWICIMQLALNMAVIL